MSSLPGFMHWQLQTPCGLRVSASSSEQGHAHETISHPGLRLIVLLTGELELQFGIRRFHIEAGQLGSLLLVNLTGAERFVRHATAIRHERKLCIDVSRAWLDQRGLSGRQTGPLARMTGQHLASQQQALTPLQHTLADSLLAEQGDGGPLADLQRESRVLNLLGGLLRPRGLAPEARQRPLRLLQLKEKIDQGEVLEWDIARMAQFACMSPNTLQRHFRQHFGHSVGDYQRLQRLESARQALLHGSQSITRIALEAGYTSPANFATAFKRAFGLAPSACRQPG